MPKKESIKSIGYLKLKKSSETCLLYCLRQEIRVKQTVLFCVCVFNTRYKHCCLRIPSFVTYDVQEPKACK